MIRKQLYTAMALCALLLVQSGCKKDYDDGSTGTPRPGQAAIEWEKAADSSTAALVQKFWNASGNYFNEKNTNTNFHYWPQAHALDVLVDAYVRTGKAEYKELMNKWMTGVKAKNGGSFLNEFYDDMEWNALAMLRAHEATGEAVYKEAVDAVWADIKTGWNNTMGGGIAWRKAMPYYKNTPANAPAAILAARLYKKFNNPDDLVWSKKIYAWLKDSLYNKSTGWVYDGINSDNDGKRNTTWKFTYNQGTFIGAATELYSITNDQAYLNDALQATSFALTDAGITNFNDNLLRDEGGGDGGLFKGVLVRYLTQLVLAPGMLSSDKTRIVNFLKHNAQTLWNTGTDKNNLLYGPYWKTPPGASTDLTIQLSGATLMEAMALLKEKDLL
ncbi:MAG TPA: glycoside hydrolase family 76 protein [Chitinophagaceae bacterium]|jgi:predicted alpha-1,6-mannanase (GH76 family)|nr:glycoside hydrolase family 76 protein [Chitinophagaceae bacterium]